MKMKYDNFNIGHNFSSYYLQAIKRTLVWTVL